MTSSPGRLALIASRGTRATGAPAFMLATAAATVGWEVAVFFTFHGVALLAEDLELPLAGASAQAPAADTGSTSGETEADAGPGTARDTDRRKRASDQAYGPFGGIGWPVPEFLAGLPPAFAAMASEHLDPPPGPDALMDIETMRNAAAEAGVRLYACSHSMTLLGLEPSALGEHVTPGGAPAFLAFSREADVSFAF